LTIALPSDRLVQAPYLMLIVTFIFTSVHDSGQRSSDPEPTLGDPRRSVTT
jgi:hypothetical protein